MARIMAFDYGTKRIGIAVTDPEQLIATALTAVHPKDVIDFLTNYLQKEMVECFVVGEPKQLNGKPSEVQKPLTVFINTLKNNFKNIELKRYDERFTSKIATNTMLLSGLKKKQRKNKSTIDEISATIILQDYLINRGLQAKN